MIQTLWRLFSRGPGCFLPGILLVCNVGAQVNLQKVVDSLLAHEKCGLEHLGVVITDLRRDSVLVAVNPDSQFIPASVAKLVTGAQACELLGLGYTFTTSVYHDSSFDRDSGLVRGNLYIRGSGDPGFTAERLWLFVQHLRHQGLRHIAQDLVLDDSFFDSVTSGPGYNEDKSSRAYEAPVAALSASFNSVAVHVAPGTAVGSPVIVQPFPPISGVKIVNTAKTVAVKGSGSIQVETKVMDGKTAIIVYGGMALDAKPRYIYRKVWETSENFGWVLQGLFAQSGITLGGSVRRGRVPETLVVADPWYRFESEPMNTYLNHMFKYSSNFTAEMIFKTMAAHADSAPGSWERGQAGFSRWWQETGLPGLPVMVNGSGMGNRNRISPRQCVALLQRVYRSPYAPEYVSALSIAAGDGTLSSRFAQSRYKGSIRGKTGTLNDYGVSSLAGYVLTPQHTLAFAVLVNGGLAQYSAWMLQERVLEAILQKLE